MRSYDQTQQLTRLDQSFTTIIRDPGRPLVIPAIRRIYLRRNQKPDEQLMKSMKTNNRFTPLENSINEQQMNWDDDALRPAHDAKEMSPHLQPTDRLHTDDYTTKRLSSKTHAKHTSSSSKTKKHATNCQVHVLSHTLFF